MGRYLFIIIFLMFSISIAGCVSENKADTVTVPPEYSAPDSSVPELEYLEQLPKAYWDYPDRKWPLILFLHGAGEVGGTLEDLRKMAKTHSIPKVAAEKADFPFVAISPLCPKDREWTDLHPSLINLLDKLKKKYRIDPERVYLTGLSMGGGGTWSLAMEYPERFAAIAPVCGYGDTSKVGRIKELPVWAFHGEKDDIISIHYQQVLVNALKAAGGDVKFTVYPEVAHDAWVKAYETPELYDWFLQHKCTQRDNN